MKRFGLSISLLVIVCDSVFSQTSPPDPPRLLRPLSGATVDLSPTLQWLHSSGATNYWLQVSEDQTFDQLLVNDSTLTDTSFQIGPLKILSEYFWRVCAANSAGWGSWSSVYLFFTTFLTEAPEKWSMPVKVWQLSAGRLSFASQPTLTADGKTLYFVHYNEDSAHYLPGGIYKAVWTDTGWSAPTMLNSNVNTYLSEGPSISPDGKRLYYRSYGRPESYGYWDLYYSDWDSVKQEWGPAVNLGPNVNSDRDDWGCFTPDNKHLYWNPYGGQPRISVWSDSLGAWGPSQPVDVSKFLGCDGREAVPGNRRKVYYQMFTGDEYHGDIYVNYFDTTTSQWSYAMWLNLNRLLDTLVTDTLSGYYRIEEEPWISPDGHTLYFGSTHDTTYDIWMSKMVIDENGNPVDEVRESPLGAPHEFELLQNYPNPFNPTTMIRYELPHASFVTLKVCNILGQEVAILVNEVKQPGTYAVEFNGSNLASGVYFYRMQAANSVKVRRMLLVR